MRDAVIGRPSPALGGRICFEARDIREPCPERFPAGYRVYEVRQDFLFQNLERCHTCIICHSLCFRKGSVVGRVTSSGWSIALPLPFHAQTFLLSNPGCNPKRRENIGNDNCQQNRINGASYL